jgi:6-pyruvoyltetrahydropterin/6-carboxytetrahydropterin synthase
VSRDKVATVYLTRVVQFSAAHRYFRPEWSEERNREVFGACASPHGHGHTYQCRVTVKGTPDPRTGMVVDLARLDAVLREEVVERFDHRHINYDVAEFAPGGAVPTGESLCLDIWRRVAARLPRGCALAMVRVQEEPHLYAEYRGEDGSGPPD